MAKIQSIEKYSTKKLDISNVLDNDICHLNNLFSQNGFKLLITGGAVRDLILAEKPNDIDFATDAKPDEIIEKFKDISDYRILDTAKRYGCISFQKDKKKYEVTSFRKDVATYGRAAKICYTKDIYEDAMRRDFLCNSMYLSFDGTLYDPLNAYQDTLDRKVTFIGDAYKRIHEDHLRILRYLRLTSKLNTKKIDLKELHICKKEKSLLLRLAKEQIKGEIIKLTQSMHSPDIIARISLREFLDLFNIKINNCRHIQKLKLIKEKFGEYFQNPLFEFTLTLDNSISQEDIIEVLKELKFTNSEIKEIKIIQELLHQSKILVINSTDAYIYRYGKEFTRYAIIIYWLYEVESMQSDDLIELLEGVDKKSIPEFPIESTDFFRLGLKPGKDLGLIRKNLKELWLSSNCQLTKTELLRKIDISLPSDNGGQ